ncbi:estrogen-related receptor gamma [Erpetoichthys calabaricus]|uniref:estrogen-related receptor gamma n=1 Tax=Erpetoichthys calabaricus TaxID=27687 RepID=UPI002234E2D6|nr:estrogen-related receptor gamma [Erpetoichthys calabaricus]
MNLKHFCVGEDLSCLSRYNHAHSIDDVPFLKTEPSSPSFTLDSLAQFSPGELSDSSVGGSSLMSRRHSLEPDSPSPFCPLPESCDDQRYGAEQSRPVLSAAHHGQERVYSSALSSGSKRLCLVCGDLASGYHYGVASCEACKAFFKRTIQGNIEYSCPVVNECEITKRRRKSCQACRFRKCLQVGMMKEGVRMDRVRGGRQKYRRRIDAGSALILSTPCTQPKTSTANKVISHLLVTEPRPMCATPDANTADSSSIQTLMTLCDLLNRELLMVISWAKQIPGFSSLSIADQMSLLQSGWMETLVISVVSRSLSFSEELYFAENCILDRMQCRNTGLLDLHTALHQLVTKYQKMGLSPEELVTLKAMALANADSGHIENMEAVQQLQDHLHEALQDYEAQQHPQDPHRTGKLLMTLPLLRQSASRATQTFLRLQTEGRVPMHKLFLEMLEVNM